MTGAITSDRACGPYLSVHVLPLVVPPFFRLRLRLPDESQSLQLPLDLVLSSLPNSTVFGTLLM
jgi:hypothetical protein